MREILDLMLEILVICERFFQDVESPDRCGRVGILAAAFKLYMILPYSSLLPPGALVFQFF